MRAEVTLNFQDAERIYRDLRQQHAEGNLTDEDFETEVAKLWCQDEQGHWWLLGVETGEWYRLDGENWIKAQPPTTPATPLPAPAPPLPPATPTVIPPTVSSSAKESAAAEKGTRDNIPPARPVTLPSPSLQSGTRAAPPPASPAAASEMAAIEKYAGGNVPPAQRASAEPAGKGKNLPASSLIGIIAVVAFVAILIMISAYFILSSVLGGNVTARATTPTRSLALLPTLTSDLPTDTPVPPTSEATATEEDTPTHTPTRPTATRRPASPTASGPTPTATLNVPPGVYVTNVETIPAQVNLGDTIGFRVTFLNTMGSIQTYNWYVKWYQCPDECQDFKHSHGETLLTNSNLATGASTLTTSQNINLRTGISCNLIAVANYVDPVNQLPTPFQATKNSGQFAFTPCH